MLSRLRWTGVVEEFARLDILVNNAGVEKRAPFLEITRDDWQRQLDVNLSGTFYCAQAAARQMAKRGYGRIVNLSSVAGLIGPGDRGACRHESIRALQLWIWLITASRSMRLHPAPSRPN